jgi:hypothetical protein
MRLYANLTFNGHGGWRPSPQARGCPVANSAAVTVLAGCKMSQPEQSPQTEDSGLFLYTGPSRGEGASAPDADDEPNLSWRATSVGVMFYLVLYGGIAGIVGIGFWVTMHFL